MNHETTNEPTESDEIDLFALWQTLLEGKRTIAAITALILGLATTLAFVMTPKYEGKVVLTFADDEKGGGALSGLAGQFGGLAEMAGVSVGSGGNKDGNLAFLKSRLLIETFIKENDLLPILFSREWDSTAKKWNVNDPEDVPTLGKGFELLSKKVFEIQNDKKTGIITLVVTWKDRELAAKWANDIAKLANATLRQRAIDEAQLSLDYLKEELGKTSLVEIQNTIYRVAESQIKTKMMANTQEQFAFKIIDPAVVADEDAFVKPKRPLMIALGGIGGLILGCLWVLMRNALRKRRSASVA